MGFIKAFTGAISGTFADQWLDYLTPDTNVKSTYGIYPAVKVQGGQNTKGHDNIISNGSKILVPVNTALITMVDGAITGCITEPGGYTYTSNDANAQSIFAGDGIIGPLVKSTWDKVKHGNMAAAQHTAFYVNLNEIPDNKFGTQSEITWYDTYCEAQLGAVLRGNYSVKIEDPISFMTNLAAPEYIQPGKIFDFDDIDNNKVTGLFNDVIGVLGSAVAKYVEDPKYKEGIKEAETPLMNRIQQDAMGFGDALALIIEENRHWLEKYGLKIAQVNIDAVEYSEESKQFLNQAREADVALSREAKRIKKVAAAEAERVQVMGNAYSQNLYGNMAATSAEASLAAANNPNGAMMGVMGMNFAQQNGANMLNSVAMQQQPMYGGMPQQPMYGGMPQQPMQGMPQQSMQSMPQQPMQGMPQQPMQGMPQQPMQGMPQQPIQQPAQPQQPVQSTDGSVANQ